MPHNQVLLLLFCYIWCVVEFQFPSSQKLFDHRQEMQMKKLAVVLLCPDTQLVIWWAASCRSTHAWRLCLMQTPLAALERTVEKGWLGALLNSPPFKALTFIFKGVVRNIPSSCHKKNGCQVPCFPFSLSNAPFCHSDATLEEPIAAPSCPCLW